MARSIHSLTCRRNFSGASGLCFRPVFRTSFLTVMIMLVALPTSGRSAQVDSNAVPNRESAADSQGGLTESDIVAAQQFGGSLSIAEWLGPMAPVALSPFFGITCLSGLAIMGGDWVSPGNPLLGTGSPLNNPAVFWSFLSLTIVTSLPRLTKVSKPFAQAVDQLETWSGVVTMIVLKVLLSRAETVVPEAPAVAHAGVLSLSTDMLLIIAAAVNIVVINTVRFFFEILIWLTPVPFLDAVFEAANKALCGGLALLYAWSPLVAAAVNLFLFAAALVIFSWVHRREVFFRTMLLDSVRAMFSPSSAITRLTVFPAAAVGRIRARAKCSLEQTSDGRWLLTCPRWFRQPLQAEFGPGNRPVISIGLFSNTIRFSAPEAELTFGRRHAYAITQLTAVLGADVSNAPVRPATRAAEFA